MEFSVRFAKYDDFLECHRVEKETMGDFFYLDDAWHYFYNCQGEMICVFYKEKMVGIGRFTVLFDRSAWLETLRVVPEFQNKGVGKLIYNEYLKLSEKYGCTSMAMYTGFDNKPSAGLAQINGLEFASGHIGYNLSEFDSGNPHGFSFVNFTKAENLVMPLKNEYNNYLVFNRTFYRINKENIKGFSVEGKVFYDEKSNSTIICGARFQKGKALHIALMQGDLNKCLDFAKSLASATGVNKITCTFALENQKLESFLIENKFIREESKLKTLERVF